MDRVVLLVLILFPFRQVAGYLANPNPHTPSPELEVVREPSEAFGNLGSTAAPCVCGLGFRACRVLGRT